MGRVLLSVYSGLKILLGDVYIQGVKNRRSSLDLFVKIIFIVTKRNYYGM